MSVVFGRCYDYESGKLKDCLQDLISSLGIEQLIYTGDRVLIKPNLIAPRPVVDAVCTHPAMIRALAMIIRDCGGQPYIGDSPGYASLERCLAGSGM